MLFENQYATEIEDALKSLTDILRQQGMTVTTVESCTGGMIAASLTSLSGSSAYFKTGLVTYANESKSQLVNVKDTTLKTYGAVSEQTAREMALGGLTASTSDCAIAVTGIAGPDGGSQEKPVGLVYIGTAVSKNDVKVERYLFDGDRCSIRTQTTLTALKQLQAQL